VVGDHHLNVGVSIGIAIYPVDGTDNIQELMKKADMAMYAAKESGRNNYRFYGETTLARPDGNC
jgi:diguanylate cyclase (GGDEF)-like protein